MKRLLSMVVLALALAACGDDGTGPDGTGGSEFDITVGGGTKPTYTWSGGNAFSVSVVRVSAPGTIVWGMANPAMTITSPVTHGTVSGGGIVTASTEATLTAGVQYRIAITRADQKTGFKSFTP
jgi:hypothetical protein